MTTTIKALTTLKNKFTKDQLEAIQNNLISLSIKEGERYYRSNTVLLFGEDNANASGNYISKIDIEDGCVYVNDGDGDTAYFQWTGANCFASINLLVEESYFDEQEKFNTALTVGEPSTLLELSLAEKALRDDLEQQLKAITSKLEASKGKIDKIDNKVKELFKL